MYPSEVLNKIKWRGNPDFQGVKIIYTSRGELNDQAMVSGFEIKELEKSFFIAQRKDKQYPTIIPYHRIEQIYIDDKLIWDIVEPKKVMI